MDNNGGQRQQWGSRLQFLLTCIGYAVGIGNIWRFPYLTYRFGGGTFLIPYMLALAVIGVPLYILELLAGQYFRRSLIKVWSGVNKRYKGIGWASVLLNFIISSYYSILISWSLMFLVSSFHAEVPWANDAKGFYEKTILNLTNDVYNLGPPQLYPVLALVGSMILVFFAVSMGIKSSGRVSVVIVTLPYAILLVLFIFAMTLEGAKDGIMYYMSPRWDQLLNWDMWVQATAQIFFSLGPCFGIITAFGSFLDRKENAVRDSIIVAITNSATSIFGGFIIFSFLGHFSATTGTPISAVAESGPGLVFVIYPAALSLLPGAPFFSAVFFLMLYLLGMSSQVATVVGLVSVIEEELHDTGRFPKLKTWWISAIICILLILAGLPYTTQGGLYLLDLFDHYVPQFMLLFIGVFETIAIGYTFGSTRFLRVCATQSGNEISQAWGHLWRYVLPFVLGALIIAKIIRAATHPFSGYVLYPPWTVTMGWFVSLLAVVPLAWWGLQMGPYAAYWWCKIRGKSVPEVGGNHDQYSDRYKHGIYPDMNRTEDDLEDNPYDEPLLAL